MAQQVQMLLQAGVKQGDQLLQVDGRSLAGLQPFQVSSLIGGAAAVPADGSGAAGNASSGGSNVGAATATAAATATTTSAAPATATTLRLQVWPGVGTGVQLL